MLNVGAGAMLLLTERLPRSWPSCYGQKLSPGFNGRGLFQDDLPLGYRPTSYCSVVSQHYRSRPARARSITRPDTSRVEVDQSGIGQCAVLINCRRGTIRTCARKGRNDMRTTWCVILIAASAMIGTIDVLHAQPEENPGRNEFLRSCASCHGVSGKGDGPVAKSLSPPPSDLTRLSEANDGVFPISRVHEVIDGRIESLIHGTRDMPVWGDRYMQEMISRESRDFVSKEWNEAIVRRRILALVEYISTLQRATRRSR
jgi:cytochrome c553